MSQLPRYPLVIFDLDGTLVDHGEPIWKTLHTAFGSDMARRDALMKKAFAGDVSYADWFHGDLDIMRDAGAQKQDFIDVFRNIRPQPGAHDVVNQLRHAGSKVAVISGGVDLMLDVVLPDLTFDAVHINRIFFDSNDQISGGEATPYDQETKVTGMLSLCERYGCGPEEVFFVGDGRNDIDIARAAGTSIAWGNAPDGLIAVATAHEPGPDLRVLLPRLFRPTAP